MIQKRLMLPALLMVFAVSAQDTLQAVKIDNNRKTIKRSSTLTANTATMTSKELLKAACCNLAESFETNPAIDVNFSDAVTGVKQIRMLGLSSPYLMITEENIPSVRGASQAYGLSFTPGTWVESIQVTKGAGSVVNGYESISGQINTELQKPISADPFFLNLYGDSGSRWELNTHFSRKLSHKWSSSLFLHGNARLNRIDMNGDGFLDNPLGQQLNLLNRWQYQDASKGWVGFVTLRYMDDDKIAGQMDFDEHRDKGTTNFWGSGIRTRRYGISTKTGYVFPDMPYQSIGWQNAFTNHDQNSYYGLNTYNIAQKSYYSNLIFNSIINNTRHKFSTGLNFALDTYSEYVAVPGIDRDFDRMDNSFGAFFEYTFDSGDHFSLIAGLRGDLHNRLGAFVTPRLHVRYNPWEKATLRASAGRGKRAANIFAENQQLFASSRHFSVWDTSGKIYGLNAETAWNYGMSFNQGFLLFGKSLDAGIDFYRTDFVRQAVVDLYQSPQQALFYNLRGNASATSLQIDLNAEPIRRLNIRAAYKWYDVSNDYLSGHYQKPLQARERWFANASYETALLEKDTQWKFDLTWNLTGTQRLPFTATNPSGERLPGFSPAYSLVSFQLTRVFSNAFEMYLGGENIGNYRQQKAILGSGNPFGAYFDASILYAPVFGQMFYTGLRYKIQ